MLQSGYNAKHSTPSPTTFKPSPINLYNNQTFKESLPHQTTKMTNLSSKNLKNILPPVVKEPISKTTSHSNHTIQNYSPKNLNKTIKESCSLKPSSLSTMKKEECFLDDNYYLEEMRKVLSKNLSNHRSLPQPVEVVQDVYMGTQRHADDYVLLKKLKISHVVNCAGSRLTAPHDECVPAELYPEEVGIKCCLVVGALDHEDYDIAKHFDKVISFMKLALKEGGKVLVHCNLGVNRSGAVVAAFIMVNHNMTLLKAASLLKEKRQLVLSNKGFRRQLIDYARGNGHLDPVTVENDGNTLPSELRRSSPTTVRFQLERNNIINFSTTSLPQTQNHLWQLKQKIRNTVNPSEKFREITQTIIKKFITSKNSADDSVNESTDKDEDASSSNTLMKPKAQESVFIKKKSSPITLATIDEVEFPSNQSEKPLSVPKERTLLKMLSAPDFNNKFRRADPHEAFIFSEDISKQQNNLSLQNPVNFSMQATNSKPANNEPNNNNNAMFKNKRKVSDFFKLSYRLLPSKRSTSYSNVSSLQPSSSTLSLIENFSLDKPSLSTMRPLRISTSIENNSAAETWNNSKLS